MLKTHVQQLAAIVGGCEGWFLRKDPCNGMSTLGCTQFVCRPTSNQGEELCVSHECKAKHVFEKRVRHTLPICRYLMYVANLLRNVMHQNSEKDPPSAFMLWV